MLERGRAAIYNAHTGMTSYCDMCQKEAFLELPATLEGAVTARVDHIPVDQLEVSFPARIFCEHSRKLPEEFSGNFVVLNFIIESSENIKQNFSSVVLILNFRRKFTYDMTSSYLYLAQL